MIEYSVILVRWTKGDVTIFRDESFSKAVLKMRDYVKRNGFTIHTDNGRFTIKNVKIVKKEPIVGKRVIKEYSYIDLINGDDTIKKETVEMMKKEG